METSPCQRFLGREAFVHGVDDVLDRGREDSGTSSCAHDVVEGVVDGVGDYRRGDG